MQFSYDSQPDHILERNRRARRVAVKLGLVTKGGAESLPKNLCQRVVAQERALADVATRAFMHAVRRRKFVWFVTVCRPEWTCAAGELSEELVREVRNWMSRRARNLSVFGEQRMLGFVDIAWNDRSATGGVSHWSVHAHVLIMVVGARVSKGDVRKAFACTGDGDRVRKPVVVKRPKTDADVLKVSEYNSRSLLLEHLQRRRSYYDRDGRLQSRDTSLSVAQLMEFAQLMSAAGPQRFWILSGFRRKLGSVVVHA